MDLDEYGLNKVIDVAVITNESGELPVDLVDVRTIERFKGTWGPFLIRSMSSSLRIVSL